MAFPVSVEINWAKIIEMEEKYNKKNAAFSLYISRMAYGWFGSRIERESSLSLLSFSAWAFPIS
jgi:hypothetical protein